MNANYATTLLEFSTQSISNVAANEAYTSAVIYHHKPVEWPLKWHHSTNTNRFKNDTKATLKPHTNSTHQTLSLYGVR